MDVNEVKHEIKIVKAFISEIWVGETGTLQKAFTWLEYLEDKLSKAIMKGAE